MFVGVVDGWCLFAFGFGVVGWWWRLLACGGPVFARWVVVGGMLSLGLAGAFVLVLSKWYYVLLKWRVCYHCFGLLACSRL